MRSQQHVIAGGGMFHTPPGDWVSGHAPWWTTRVFYGWFIATSSITAGGPTIEADGHAVEWSLPVFNPDQRGEAPLGGAGRLGM